MLWGRRSVSVLVASVVVVATACIPPAPGGPTVGSECGDPPTLIPGASLFGCGLMGLDLSGLDLSGADLRGANLTGADLTDADLSGADLSGANLTDADLTGANLTGAVLAGAILVGALLVNAILTGTSFSFGPVLGTHGNGGGSRPPGPNCTGPYCHGYNEVQVPTGPGRALCEPDLGGILDGAPDDAEDEGDEPFLFVPDEGQLEDLRMRSVVTDTTTSFAGATFDFSDETGGALLLRGLDLSRADFTGATFINTDLACKVADGARFSGAQFLPGTGMGGMFHISAVGADFDGAEFVSHYFCDVDLTDATLRSTSLTGFIGISCADLLPASTYNELPETLLVLDGADLSDSVIGGGPNPLPGPVVAYLSPEPDVHAPGSVAKRTSVLGTTLDGAQLEGIWLNRADFTGASAHGVSVAGSSFFRDAVFGDGWTDTTWSGSVDFDGAQCPDGTTGSAANPCFPVA